MDQNTMREVTRLLFLWRGTSSAECPLDESDWKLFCDTALTFPRLRHIEANCLYSESSNRDSADCERSCERLRGALQHLNRIVKVASRDDNDFGVRSASDKCHLIHSLSLPVPSIPLVLRRRTAYKSPWMDIAGHSDIADCVTCRWLWEVAKGAPRWEGTA